MVRLPKFFFSEISCLHKMLSCSTQLWAGMFMLSFSIEFFYEFLLICFVHIGANLSDLKQDALQAHQFMKEMGHPSTMLSMMSIQKSILTLLGDDEKSLNDAELETGIQENRNPRQTMIL